ncbi:exoribonuclease-2 [Neisseria sp. HSC-16F19]|nr:RNB domain-containing ribonuclease [Neisseria sp. HSC-16F19]MCP2040611.1 exoribonuclease-2 [Neisseria sp. HSC-16F19]
MSKHIFYEESGQFKAAVIVQQNEATYLVDTLHGKRSKVKANHVFLTFDGDPEAFLQAAAAAAAEIDTDLLWEVCGSEEFSGEEAAREYFGAAPQAAEYAGTLMALYAAPVYFHKKSKGVFKAVLEETLKQALQALERKKQQDAQLEAWVTEMAAGRLPEAVAADLRSILHMPDKQSLTYKAFTKAAEAHKHSPLAWAQHLGGVTSLPQYFLDGFLCKHFPKGTDWAAQDVPPLPDLPEADVQAFSIDGVDTTEIDDALSVTLLDNGHRRIGIHIAAPSLVVQADDAAETEIFARQSTVYYPGGKITMLPENWIAAFSLDTGGFRPAVSLYAEVDADFQVLALESRVERVWIADNLRIEAIEAAFQPQAAREEAEAFPHQQALNWLYDFAIAQQKARGKYEPERPPQYDYSIDFDAGGRVCIARRERGSPIDTVVSEMMILANSTWAKMLDEAGLPGLFRIQTTGKVRMSTQAQEHVGLGLQHYAWFTSPLRRAADYINQKQLLSLLLPDTAPRFQPKDAMLFAAVGQFESAHAVYGDFQRQMEAYWSLVYIREQGLRELTAVVLKEELVRIEGLPLVARATGIPFETLPKTRIKLAVGAIDLATQSIGLQYVTVLPLETAV